MVIKTLAAALVLVAAANGAAAQQPDQSITVARFDLTPKSLGCVMARVVEPANTLATIALVVETRADGAAIALHDTRL